MVIKHKNKGFALIIVLISVEILSLIAMNAASAVSMSYKAGRADLNQSTAAALVDAAINRAILGLVDARPGHRWRVDGVPRDFMFNDVLMTVSIQDELGKIDLNAADEELLNGLFRSSGASAEQAAVLVRAVVDRRDAGLNLGGALDGARRASLPLYAPEWRRFQRADELLLLRGITPELYRRMQPALTVYSGNQRIDPQTAPKEALLALPSMDDQTVEAIIAARSIVGYGRDNRDYPGIIDPSLPISGRVFTIDVKFQIDGQQYSKSEIVRITGNKANPYWVIGLN